MVFGYSQPEMSGWKRHAAFASVFQPASYTDLLSMELRIYWGKSDAMLLPEYGGVHTPELTKGIGKK